MSPWLRPMWSALGGPQVDVAELEALMARGAVRVLDVREDSEFRSGRPIVR